MCGIFGFAGSPDRQLLGRMAAAIVHRGPDDAGAFETPSVSLGHRRLSIIDREGGHQPVANEDETVWLVYNGEVYNYRELRAELEAAGHTFRTHCDSEVIVHAYEEWGAACAARFNGMWAFAVADLRGAGEDGRGGKLVLNRDHFGIKPLYYARSPQSGRPALRQRDQGAAAGPRAGRRAGRADDLRVPAARVPRPPRRDVLHGRRTTCRRPPGSSCRWTGPPERLTAPAAKPLRRPARSPPLESTPYWTPVLTRDGGDDPADFRRRFRESVERRLVSEVPVGSCLVRRPRLDDDHQLHERAAEGGRAGRGVAARPAQDLQRRVRRRPHRRARVHRDGRREHRRRHHVHQPDVARVHRRAARLRLAPGRAHRQHRPLRAVVRDALRARAGHRAARRAGRRRADRRLRAVPARLPAPVAQGGQVRPAAQGGHGLARRAHAAGQAAAQAAPQAPRHELAAQAGVPRPDHRPRVRALPVGPQGAPAPGHAHLQPPVPAPLRGPQLHGVQHREPRAVPGPGVRRPHPEPAGGRHRASRLEPLDPARGAQGHAAREDPPAPLEGRVHDAGDALDQGAPRGVHEPVPVAGVPGAPVLGRRGRRAGVPRLLQGPGGGEHVLLARRQHRAVAARVRRPQRGDRGRRRGGGAERAGPRRPRASRHHRRARRRARAGAAGGGRGPQGPAAAAEAESLVAEFTPNDEKHLFAVANGTVYARLPLTTEPGRPRDDDLDELMRREIAGRTSSRATSS